jgi:nucleotide-binding universal stress UspA family protein
MFTPPPEPTPFSWRIILVGLDRSEHGDLALTRGLQLAAKLGSTLHVVHAVPFAPPVTPGAIPAVAMPPSADEVAAHLRRRLEMEAARWSTTDGRLPTLHVRKGQPAKIINEVADEVGADLIVLGTHGRSGLERMLLGSVSETVSRHSSCTVLLVRPKNRG